MFVPRIKIRVRRSVFVVFSCVSNVSNGFLLLSKNKLKSNSDKVIFTYCMNIEHSSVIRKIKQDD